MNENNEKLRIGLYGSRYSRCQTKAFIQHIQKKSANITLEIIDIKPRIRTTEDEYDQLTQALQDGVIDVALMDGMKFIRGQYRQIGRQQYRVEGAAKRRDSSNVLVCAKKRDKAETEQTIIANDHVSFKQMNMINEGISCVYEMMCMGSTLKKIREKQYYGAVLPSGDLKLLKYHRDRHLQYTYYDCESFVPACGQGLVVAVMAESSSDEHRMMLRKLSHRDSLRELQIEQKVLDVIHREILSALENDCRYRMNLLDICVNAHIEHDKLTIHLFMPVHDEESIRITVCGLVEEKNRMIYQMIEKIKKKLVRYL